MIISFSTLQHDQCPEDVYSGPQDHQLVYLQDSIHRGAEITPVKTDMRSGGYAVCPFYTGWCIMHITFQLPIGGVVLFI